MTSSKQVGARRSPLSLAQARQGLEQLTCAFPAARFELLAFSSPGDRDRATGLDAAPPDFFTRDLDAAVRAGTIDAALHSAKDLPDTLPDGIDFLQLPWRERREDVLILRSGEREIRPGARFGVSSPRREEWVRRTCPGAAIAAIRGNVDDRIAQLDRGDFDALVLAAAGLARLGLEHRITRLIPLGELDTPADQGALALTFRAGDRWFETLRRAFVFPVVFAGGGVGDGNLTLAAQAALADCDVCLYDALVPAAALNVLSGDCLKFDVGKRDGAGGGSQADLLEKMIYYARRNRKVVRLQGGDPGIFGRLGEELSCLEKYHLPYRIIPGVSSFQAAAAALGRPLTGRGVGRGFVAATFRRAGDGRVEPPDAGEIRQFPLAVYMGARVFPDIARSLLAAGRAPDTPVAAVFDAGGPAEFTVSGRLDELVLPDTGLPGLLLVGPPAAARAEAWRPRILFAGSAGLAERAGRLIRARGGIPVLRPLLRLELAAEAAGLFDRLAGFAAVILPSPGAARRFFDLAKAQSFSLHRLPRLAVSGPATAAACREYGVIPDWTAPPPFGSAALAATLLAALPPGAAILRLHSDAAPDSLAAALRAGGMAVTEKLLYRSCRTENRLDFSGIGAILLSSASAVAALPDDVPPGLLLGAIGAPTLAAVAARFPDHPAAAGVEATLESLVEAVFHVLVNQRLNTMDIS